MKEYTLKTNSLHYRLAKVYGSMRSYQVEDLCTYVKHVIYGLLKIVFLVGFCSGLLIVLGMGDFLGWVAAMIATQGFIEPEEHTRMALGSIIGLVFALGVLFVVVLITNIHQARKEARIQKGLDGLFTQPAEPKDPPFLLLAYRSFKEKTCVKIKFDKARD